MSYDLRFHESAKKQWDKLDWTVKDQFLAVLERRLLDPKVSSAKLRDLPDCYKIKLRTVGYRLVYLEFWTIYQNPNDVGACRVHLRYLTPQAEHDGKGVERLDKNWKIATDAIINEDVPGGNGIQASANMAHAGKVCLGRNEVTNQLFHRAWRSYMDAP